MILKKIMPYFAKSNLFGSSISISEIFKIAFLKIVFLKSYRCLVKYIYKYFFFFKKLFYQLSVLITLEYNCSFIAK
jgi:hypothetical protein